MDFAEQAEKLAQEDLIDQVILCWLAGKRQVKTIGRMLEKMDVAVDEAVLAAVAEIIAERPTTWRGEEFRKRLLEAGNPDLGPRYLGKQFVKDQARAYLGHRAMLAEANEDKRTRNSAIQYHLGVLGHSPSQKHEVTADADLLKITKEIFAEKPSAE